MKLLDYYEKLRDRFGTIADFQAFPVLMEEIAETLDCTRRNTALVLQRMSAEHLIEWRPGRGRGNQSELKFLLARQELTERKIHELIGNESIQEAWQLIASLDEIQQQEFMRGINLQFGIQSNEEELDILRLPYSRQVSVLDPAQVLRSSDVNWLRQLMNKLIGYSTKEKRLVPSLAHHWESDATFKKWTFHLRKGVRFHDGHLLSPCDVIHSFKRLLSRFPSDWMYGYLANIYESSKYSVTFELTESIAAFPNIVSTDRCYIVPNGWDGEHSHMPNGTGPFRIVKNNSSMIVLEAHEHYFEGRPHLDRIEMWIWPNYKGSTLETASKQNVDMLYYDPQANEATVNQELTTLQELEQGCNYLIFNQIKPGPLQDIRLREAIHLSLDRWGMIGRWNGTRLMPAKGFIFTEENESEMQRGKASYNPTKAKELLAASSYKGEALQLYTYDNPYNRENAKWIQSSCEGLGIQVDIQIVPVEQLVETAVMIQADMISVGEVLGEQPDITLIETFRADSSLIRNCLPPKWKQTIDTRIMACLHASSQSERLSILRELQDELQEEYYLLFLHHHMRAVSHQNSLNGISMNVWGEVDYKEIWRRPKV
ncbi:ABC transporter substrate-binding protein [Paenibacillus kobensis]|uniref:ABC transporter substrate-binding protein n=1 Tax=Paenibacillus kobensis TaxID=59841 RepID=UPI000FD87B44|nr:ABC transporter substrate-binding protein [Paenibacillus kobensis]